MVLVTDDPDRENEGDLIMAADFVTPEAINFMATHAKGLICAPCDGKILDRLQLEPMVANNTDNHETAFTVSIDHVDTTTGISAAERAYTIKKLTDPKALPADFRRPGHVFPLRSVIGGVMRRTGHTETTTDLCRLAGLTPAGICCEIMSEDGTMARTPELARFAERFGLTFITVADLVAYRKRMKRWSTGLQMSPCLVSTEISGPLATKTIWMICVMLLLSRAMWPAKRTFLSVSTLNALRGMPWAPCAVIAATSWVRLCA